MQKTCLLPQTKKRPQVLFAVSEDLISKGSRRQPCLFGKCPQKPLLFYHKGKRAPKLWLIDWFYGR